MCISNMHYNYKQESTISAKTCTFVTAKEVDQLGFSELWGDCICKMPLFTGRLRVKRKSAVQTRYTYSLICQVLALDKSMRQKSEKYVCTFQTVRTLLFSTFLLMYRQVIIRLTSISLAWLVSVDRPRARIRAFFALFAGFCTSDRWWTGSTALLLTVTAVMMTMARLQHGTYSQPLASIRSALRPTLMPSALRTSLRCRSIWRTARLSGSWRRIAWMAAEIAAGKAARKVKGWTATINPKITVHGENHK